MLWVLFATRNRAPILRDVLSAYGELNPVEGGWRLAIVDNGSSDGTQDVLKSFVGRLPLTILREPRSGKNIALNRAVEFVVSSDPTGSDMVVFTDDDTFPGPGWLAELNVAYDRHSQASIFGGSILPRWEVEPPEWILRYVPLAPVYSLTSASAQPDGPIDPRLIFGPNMAVRGHIFREGVRFDESIGPNGQSYAMGSETELTLRLARRGAQSWFVASAVVEHFIRKEQLSRSSIMERAIRFGRGQHRLGAWRGPFNGPRWFGVPRYLWAKLAGKRVRAFQARLSGVEQRIFQAEWEYRFCLGEVIEARKMALGAWTSERADSPDAEGYEFVS